MKPGDRIIVQRPQKPFKATVVRVNASTVTVRDDRGKLWRVRHSYPMRMAAGRAVKRPAATRSAPARRQLPAGKGRNGSSRGTPPLAAQMRQALGADWHLIITDNRTAFLRKNARAREIRVHRAIAYGPADVRRAAIAWMKGDRSGVSLMRSVFRENRRRDRRSAPHRYGAPRPPVPRRPRAAMWQGETPPGEDWG